MPRFIFNSRSLYPFCSSNVRDLFVTFNERLAGKLKKDLSFPFIASCLFNPLELLGK